MSEENSSGPEPATRGAGARYPPAISADGGGAGDPVSQSTPHASEHTFKDTATEPVPGNGTHPLDGLSARKKRSRRPRVPRRPPIPRVVSRPRPPGYHQANTAYCAMSNFTDLYDTIHDDLRHWRERGITAEVMDWLTEQLPAWPWVNRAVGVAFVGGVPYITTDPEKLRIKRLSQHRFMLAAHLALFLSLQETFGPLLPDVELVVSTADMPTVITADYLNRTAAGEAPGVPPVLRFAKSDSYADILVPHIHFFARGFTQETLSRVQQSRERYPWGERNATLFGRFTGYDRLIDPRAPETFRRGANGTNICAPRELKPPTVSCETRKHFVHEWAPQAVAAGAPIDLLGARLDMFHHAHYKYLLNLDGQSISTRLEQLLATGSLVVKEEGGYRAFYYPLLKPHVHYKPFWRQGPEEVLDVLSWAARHDDEAAAIGARGQAFAQTYLHTRALVCYWFTIIKELSTLMRYTPARGSPEGGRNTRHWKPVAEFMEETGWAEIGEHGKALELWN
ncbi:hypothetical protein HYH03_016379 [Edaphochlamys debaryana]|uniref:Glycosyl transferase CAP10 domain-containing protein n=1 Tax=Edaphochlamys debaryana TaxID=47281 RepID=A0A836BRJ6_9CHLO|nr:hypothetical protein HYH03_016379 [Edaphochlamys debaryana]|eukprot:KAG2484899.1 hypothetical protein HYH03_016379 [Edaphochlamys debaryana]